ncbi:hypothetical protein GF342_04105 [Candidatus Woesearchaeota archaeon]|nr:hypothetical protein [Candidatus Woesearchaeota archaeon]
MVVTIMLVFGIICLLLAFFNGYYVYLGWPGLYEVVRSWIKGTHVEPLEPGTHRTILWTVTGILFIWGVLGLRQAFPDLIIPRTFFFVTGTLLFAIGVYLIKTTMGTPHTTNPEKLRKENAIRDERAALAIALLLLGVYLALAGFF